jgi:hypothetical protein
MMNVKPISLESKETWKTKLTELFWPVVRFYRKVARSLAFARIGWNNYDWDHAYLLKLMIFKMKRMQKACFEEGHHIPEKLPQQSLRLCIKLGEKLLEDDYFYFTGLHNEKWGDIEFIEKVDQEGRKYTGMGRPGVPPEKEAEERAEFVEAYKKDDSVKARDTRWFFGIMAKYQESWWD